MSGKLEIYCQYKADNVNRIGLNDEPIKPYANYFVPRRGYQETFANWEAKEKAPTRCRPTRRTTCAAPTPATTT